MALMGASGQIWTDKNKVKTVRGQSNNFYHLSYVIYHLSFFIFNMTPGICNILSVWANFSQV